LLYGTRIRLRPIAREDCAIIEKDEMTEDFQHSFNNFGLTAPGSLSRHFDEQGHLFDEKHGTLVVETLDQEIVGTISYRRVNYSPRSSAYQLGIHLFAQARHKGYGTEAVQMLTAYLFATYQIIRVEASADIENIPSQRLLEKAGFTREGILRKAQWRAGDWHDLVLYSKLRGE
jgi:aminoglycoside 6'-N-acetyltransferase